MIYLQFGIIHTACEWVSLSIFLLTNSSSLFQISLLDQSILYMSFDCLSSKVRLLKQRYFYFVGGCREELGEGVRCQEGPHDSSGLVLFHQQVQS